MRLLLARVICSLLCRRNGPTNSVSRTASFTPFGNRRQRQSGSVTVECSRSEAKQGAAETSARTAAAERQRENPPDQARLIIHIMLLGCWGLCLRNSFCLKKQFLHCWGNLSLLASLCVLFVLFVLTFWPVLKRGQSHVSAFVVHQAAIEEIDIPISILMAVIGASGAKFG